MHGLPVCAAPTARTSTASPSSSPTRQKSDHMDEDAPTIEKIHTHTDERREQRSKVRSHLRKSGCYKAAYSRKQALTLTKTGAHSGEHASQARLRQICPTL